jgi:hypothetical protein
MDVPVPPLASSIAQYPYSTQFLFFDSPTQPEGAMKFRVHLVIESDDNRPGAVEEIGVFERGQLGAENLGLTLAEARELLCGLQQAVVSAQTAQFSEEQTHCPTCGTRRARKGQHSIAFRTAFGKLSLQSPRYYQCCGAPTHAKSVSPLANLLAERTAPELVYLESKFAGLMSYGLTVSVLSEVLPLGAAINTTGVRRQVQAVAQRLEGELGEERFSFIDTCQLDLDKLPDPGPPLTVGLDGGFVHARDENRRQAGSFEVIVGKSMVEDGGAKCLAFVNREDAKPKRRLFEVLKSQGLQPNQQLMFLSDGGDTVRDLQLYLSPESEHWLDWFHITMRLTVMGQYVKGLAAELRAADKKPMPPDGDESAERIDAADIAQRLERLKWNLWHGNVRRAFSLTCWKRISKLTVLPLRTAASCTRPFTSSGTISRLTVPSSPTTAIGTATGRQFQPLSWNRLSIRSSASAWSNNSRCDGRSRVLIYCCRSGRKH